ncbi:fungal-specific transcription factor domain-containing protein [Thelonectria olida]|uniref:Fungal-specific transcription factor domain-containing protein n=1 Tax=Thelonectria olida TaxID=1576542 RepID=A0A9P8VZE5_9HYPO|nr:fungal-specific transcription factor domain-containing protein [Thelonectria olida]
MDTRLFTLTPGHLMETSSMPQHPSASNSPAIAVLPWCYSRVSAASLLAHLPPRPVTDYLVAVYFSTVHWFMVVLHEGHFLHHYRAMMDLYAQDARLLSNTDEDFTFAQLILMVTVLGGRYTSIHTTRSQKCKNIYVDFCRATYLCTSGSMDEQEFDIVRMTSQIYFVVRSSYTDILACGTISTVQLLLLLGSLYLYHGESNLAWANSGCTIRAAQALGLHKENSGLGWSSPYYRSMEREERSQLRRRLFWAVHTSDRFLAMCYGLPLLIADKDCAVDAPCEDNVYPAPGSTSLLMIEDDLDQERLDSSAASESSPVTLLTYQTYKIHIYIILGEILSCLYCQSSGGGTCLSSKSLMESVERLEAKLQNWQNHVPNALRLTHDMTYPEYSKLLDGEDVNDDDILLLANEDLTIDSAQVQKRRLRIRKGIYGIQALLLQLAYDNALILIHRPILAMKNNTNATLAHETFSKSVEACWRAALRISHIGKHHIFRQNQQAHAISYVGVHLFTAGVVLSVFGSSAPLSRRAWEAKQGLTRIIRMQRILRKKVIVSSQGLFILENLAREVVKKEMSAILAQDMDDDKELAGPEPASQHWATEHRATAASWSTTNMGFEGQHDVHSSVSAAATHPGLSSGLLANLPDNPHFISEDDLFNESVLDLEKCKYFHHPADYRRGSLSAETVLSDPQFSTMPDPRTMDHDTFASHNSQPAGLWCFSYE